MKNRLSFLIITIAFAPSALLLSAALIMGDSELFMLLNQRIANPILDFACVYVSPFLFSVFYVLTLITLHFSKVAASTASGVISFITGPLSYGIGSLLKILVGRPRPFEVLFNVRVIGLWHTSSFSFPSTLTMLAFGFAFPILLEKRRMGAILVALAYFIGFSVIYAGFHFPLDVVGGTLFSLAIALGTNTLKKPITNMLKRYKLKESENTIQTQHN